MPDEEARRVEAVEPGRDERVADGDGVVNSEDRCPNTPPGVSVDSTGCERDDDRELMPSPLITDLPGTTTAALDFRALLPPGLLQRMLRARGIGGTVFIGADTADEQGEPGFSAHAWLMCGEHFVTGEGGNERYTVVAEFSWV